MFKQQSMEKIIEQISKLDPRAQVWVVIIAGLIISIVIIQIFKTIRQIISLCRKTPKAQTK